MFVGMLVLGTCLLCIAGIVANFMSHQREAVLDDRSIRTTEEFDAALSIQQDMRVADLERRVTDRNWLAYALLGTALLMQLGALVADHFAHPSIARVGTVPAFFIVMAARASRRRDAQRQLNHLRRERS